ncbi:MAG: long-chain fatty acid--CoA ligase [Gammaproteobacteria bacterium]|nr:long-chain fatty acid--CoA ligase [Gammaproteobacteria bacterium]
MRVESAKSIPELFARRVRLSPDKLAYRQFTGDRWQEMTWSDVAHEAGRWQKALVQEQLAPGDRVAICMRNSINWVLFDQAAMALGLVTVPLFYNDRPDNMAWCINDSGAKLLVLEDGKICSDLLGQVKTLHRVVCANNAPAGQDERVTGLSDWLPAQGDYQANTALTEEDLATVVYTSGTTGRPKGVMLTHGNLISDLFALSYACYEINGDDEFLSFLPLSHMFERTVGYYIAITVGALTTFARGIPELAEDMANHRPTLLVCVPRIFERIYNKVQEGLPQGSLKRFLFEKAVDIGWKRYQGKAGPIDHMLWPVFDALVGKKLRGRLGGRVKYILLGGAPMPAHLFKTFIGLGITFLHGYGLTETSPVISFNRVNDNDPFSVGAALDNVETRLGDNSELQVRGPVVMKGYWDQEQATAEVVDKDGWFHTGDVAEIRNNHIYITGRVKDIIVMSNGEKVSPGDVEQAILADTVFEQVMLIGEGRPKLGLLVVSSLADEKELCRRANNMLHDFPGYAKIRYVISITEPWTVENGLLTPTLKTRRQEIEKRYASELGELFTQAHEC